VGLLDHMADLCLVFKEASILFSRVVALACIPTVPTPVAGGVFDDGYSSMGEMESECGFNLSFIYG
jgi:hypothetical protein